MEDFSYMLDNLKHRLYLQETYKIRLCDYIEGHAYMHVIYNQDKMELQAVLQKSLQLLIQQKLTEDL